MLFYKQSPCGTLYFVAPEVIFGSSYNAMKSDIWSFGMTAYMLIHHNIPFPDVSTCQYIKNIKELGSYLEQKYHGRYNDLIYGSLTLNPEDRKTAKELLNDPLFQNAEDISYIQKLKKDHMQKGSNKMEICFS